MTMDELRKPAKATMKTLLTLLLSVIAVSAAQAATNTIRVAWNKNPEPDVIGYKLHRGSAPGVYTETNHIIGVTEVEVRVVTGTTNYFALSAYNADQESQLSTELVYYHPLPAPSAPKNLRVIVSLQTASSPGGPWETKTFVTTVAPPAPESMFFRSHLIITNDIESIPNTP